MTKAIFFIVALSIIIYSNSLGGEFAWDDEYFVIKNTYIRSLDNIGSFFTDPATVAFSGLSKDVYRPLSTVTFALNYFFSGLDTFGYHLTNVMLHTANGVLVFILLYLISGSMLAAFLAALFFVCHPVQTEVVSWISGRSSVLFLVFYLLSLIFYAKYSRTARREYYFASLMACLAALFSKEMAVTLPFVIILYDIHFSKRDGLLKRALSYLPFFAFTAFYLLTRSSFLGRVSQCPWWGGSAYYTYITMAKVFVTGYMRVLAWPQQLCAFYHIPVSRSIADPSVVFSAIFLVALFALIPFIYKRSRLVSFAILFFFVTMVPVSNIVPLKALMAERFLYLPSIGFCLLLALGIERLASGRSADPGRDKGSLYLLPILLAVSILIAYSSKTIERNEEWRDARLLSEALIKVSPSNAWAYSSLGVTELSRKNYDRALVALKKAVALSENFPTARNAIGACYLETGKFKEAAEALEGARKLDPENVETINSLGVAYAQLKRLDDAERTFKEAIATDPRFIITYLNLGALYAEKGMPQKSIEEYLKICEITNFTSDLAVACVRIGDMYRKMGDEVKAEESYRKALQVCGNSLPQLKKVVESRGK